MVNNNLVDHLSHLVLELGGDGVGSLVVYEHLHTSQGNLVHVLQCCLLVLLVQLRSELEGCLVLGVVTNEWNLLEHRVDELWILSGALVGGQWHELELNDTAGGGHDVVLSFHF